MNHNAPHAFVAVNYVSKLGLFGLLFHFFSKVLFLQIDLILCLFFLAYQVDSWDDLQDDSGNTLHIGKLEYKTKHGKKPGCFLDNVFPRDVKSALCLLVNLFLEQPKIKDKDSNISDSLMKSIKTSAVNEGLHAHSFGKVISFVLRFK
jgi:hypothetical protein